MAVTRMEVKIVACIGRYHRQNMSHRIISTRPFHGSVWRSYAERVDACARQFPLEPDDQFKARSQRIIAIIIVRKWYESRYVRDMLNDRSE
jgi:hypothetical protein